jgi:hypothetical protein
MSQLHRHAEHFAEPAPPPSLKCHLRAMAWRLRVLCPEHRSRPVVVFLQRRKRRDCAFYGQLLAKCLRVGMQLHHRSLPFAPTARSCQAAQQGPGTSSEYTDVGSAHARFPNSATGLMFPSQVSPSDREKAFTMSRGSCMHALCVFRCVRSWQPANSVPWFWTMALHSLIARHIGGGSAYCSVVIQCWLCNICSLI